MTCQETTKATEELIVGILDRHPLQPLVSIQQRLGKKIEIEEIKAALALLTTDGKVQAVADESTGITLYKLAFQPGGALKRKGLTRNLPKNLKNAGGSSVSVSAPIEWVISQLDKERLTLAKLEGQANELEADIAAVRTNIEAYTHILELHT